MSRIPSPLLEMCFAKLFHEEQRCATRSMLERKNHQTTNLVKVAYAAQAKPSHWIADRRRRPQNWTFQALHALYFSSTLGNDSSFVFGPDSSSRTSNLTFEVG
ncbi:hypothetical protein FEM48_Zijuj01G0216300 [Ziziphus jujuba var. spinosa]|uniref:Uncharacterized protein n=1 Tax=Ziziphus jujuba var. spinosa TaxID=714518 RepID=A0A978W3P9_ZIZJJ|nr:hypothetical protein FEM48_Zijuj01G0216300 [Ziziphus jujuba var. spinosa]